MLAEDGAPYQVSKIYPSKLGGEMGMGWVWIGFAYKDLNLTCEITHLSRLLGPKRPMAQVLLLIRKSDAFGDVKPICGLPDRHVTVHVTVKSSRV